MRLSLLFLLLPFTCISQQTINADQFFALGLSYFEPVEKPDRESVNFSLVEKYEFRTETRDFNLNEQEYTFRLSPSTPKIRRAQRAYYEELINAPDFDGEEIYCDYFLSLHSDWLSLYVLNENIRALNELAIILGDKQTIYERMVGIYEVDLQDLVELQTDRSDLEISLNALRQEREFLLQKYNLQDQEIDFGGFITVEAVSEYLAANVFSSTPAALVDLEAEHETQLLMKELELEASERSRIVDFLQLRYNGPHSDGLEERVSVGLGFQINTSGGDKLKMEELQIEQEELNRKSEREIQEKQERLTTLENELQRAILVFFHFQEITQQERTQLQGLASGVAQTDDKSLLLLLEIEERSRTMEMRSLSRMEDLLRDYLKYLQESGEMCQSEFVNYLAR
jgi:hypothetical protein